MAKRVSIDVLLSSLYSKIASVSDWSAVAEEHSCNFVNGFVDKTGQSTERFEGNLLLKHQTSGVEVNVRVVFNLEKVCYRDGTDGSDNSICSCTAVEVYTGHKSKPIRVDYYPRLFSTKEFAQVIVKDLERGLMQEGVVWKSF